MFRLFPSRTFRGCRIRTAFSFPIVDMELMFVFTALSTFLEFFFLWFQLGNFDLGFVLVDVEASFASGVPWLLLLVPHHLGLSLRHLGHLGLANHLGLPQDKVGRLNCRFAGAVPLFFVLKEFCCDCSLAVDLHKLSFKHSIPQVPERVLL